MLVHIPGVIVSMVQHVFIKTEITFSLRSIIVFNVSVLGSFTVQ